MSPNTRIQNALRAIFMLVGMALSTYFGVVILHSTLGSAAGQVSGTILVAAMILIGAIDGWAMATRGIAPKIEKSD